MRPTSGAADDAEHAQAGAAAAGRRGAADVSASAVLTGGAAHGVVRGGDVVRVVNGVEVHDHEHATAILRQCAGEVDMWVERERSACASTSSGSTR